MKILILANNDIGLYQFRRELIKKLIDTGSEVFISLPYGELIKPLEETGCIFIDTPVDRRGINPVTDFGLAVFYIKLLRRINPNLVITYTIKPNVYGGIASRLLKKNYASNITGLGTAFQKDDWLKKLVTFLYKQALRRAKTVFFENSGNMKIFTDLRIIKHGQGCLLNGAGVNLEHYGFFPYPEDTGITRFLFIGRIMKEKGVNELFDAVKRLKKDGGRCILDIVGEYEENYKGKIEEYEAEGWLKYHGFQKDVRPFIKNCNCFVLPSWHEGMANTNLECASMGRPVITSRIHGCMEAVEENVTGYLCRVKDSKDLYFQMKRFMQLTGTERAEMGKQSRRRMEKMFDKNKVVEKTMEELGI